MPLIFSVKVVSGISRSLVYTLTQWASENLELRYWYSVAVRSRSLMVHNWIYEILSVLGSHWCSPWGHKWIYDCLRPYGFTTVVSLNSLVIFPLDVLVLDVLTSNNCKYEKTFRAVKAKVDHWQERFWYQWYEPETSSQIKDDIYSINS